jgi:hypothetical protein
VLDKPDAPAAKPAAKTATPKPCTDPLECQF